MFFTWHILAPVCFLAGVLSIWWGARARPPRPPARTLQPPVYDPRDWHGVFMRDVKSIPRSWR